MREGSPCAPPSRPDIARIFRLFAVGRHVAFHLAAVRRFCGQSSKGAADDGASALPGIFTNPLDLREKVSINAKGYFGPARHEYEFVIPGSPVKWPAMGMTWPAGGLRYTAFPPTPVLVELANALDVTTDEPGRGHSHRLANRSPRST
jgi:hypothetical protein